MTWSCITPLRYEASTQSTSTTSARTSGTAHSESRLLLQLVDSQFYLARHPDLAGPGPRKTFSRPFARHVDSHLRAKIGEPAGVVERIHGPERELNVALGVDMVQRLPCHFADVLHIDIFVHHHDALGEHGLTQTPDGAHHFACVPGIRLPYRDQHQVVEDAFRRHRDVANLRYLQPHQREKNALDGLAHVVVLHGRRPDDGRRVNRLPALRDE